MVRKTGVQSQVESYQRIRKWYLIQPCIIRYGSRVQWSNAEKGVRLFHTPRFSSNWKGSLQVNPNPAVANLHGNKSSSSRHVDCRDSPHGDTLPLFLSHTHGPSFSPFVHITHRFSQSWGRHPVSAQLLSYLPNPSARAGYDTRSIF